MRRWPNSPSTRDRAGLCCAVAALVVTLGACSDDSATTTTPPTTVAPPPTPSVSQAPPDTTLPAPTGIEVEVVERCEAGDQRIVAAPVVPIGGEMAVGPDQLWISSLAAGGLVPVDAATLCPREAVSIPNAPFGVTSMAVADDGTVYTAAARTGGLAAVAPDGTVTTFAPGVDGGGGVALADGMLWAICCDGDGDGGGDGAVIDVSSGEVVAEFALEGPGVGVGAAGDTAWAGRRDTAGIDRIRLTDDGVTIESFEAFGTTTVDVAVSGDGTWLVTDEPVLQRFSDGEIDEATVLPFPRERGVDLDVDPDGGVWAVSAFGPGIVWLRPDGVAFNALGAENLIQVEATDERVWALTTDGALVRLDRSVVDG